jgi:hypothetical protein
MEDGAGREREHAIHLGLEAQQTDAALCALCRPQDVVGPVLIRLHRMGARVAHPGTTISGSRQARVYIPDVDFQAIGDRLNTDTRLKPILGGQSIGVLTGGRC